MRFIPILCCCLVLTQLVGVETDLQTSLKLAYTENLNASIAEDLDRIGNTMHPESPARTDTLALQKRMFDAYDLNIELTKFKYLSTHDGLAMARLSQRTTKVKGPHFRNNLVDSIVVFKEDDKGNWKIFTQAILEVKFD